MIWSCGLGLPNRVPGMETGRISFSLGHTIKQQYLADPLPVNVSLSTILVFVLKYKMF
jgi:hypothetical protein